MFGNMSTKYLIPGDTEDGFLNEVEDDKINDAIFIVSYTNTNDGYLSIPPDINIEKLKQLPSGFQHAVLKVCNNVDWDSAENFNLLKHGKAFLQKAKTWNSCKPISVELIASVAASSNKTHQKLKAATLNNNSDLREKIELVRISRSSSIPKKRVQYLKTGRGTDDFFFEGKVDDRTGASFLVKYEEGSSEGDFYLIVDVANLRTMDVGFRKKVIKIINNGLILKDATEFKHSHPGKVKYDANNHVWVIISPLEIEIN